jgi:dipeptidyl aminopeptidase/acylaminoacyl peptidase
MMLLRTRAGRLAAPAALLVSMLAALASMLAGQPAAAAEPSAPPTLEELLKPPTTALPTLSRTGKYLAITTPVKDRMNIAVIDMTSRKGTLLTNFEDFDVVELHWVGDERLVFSLGQRNAPTGLFEFQGGGLFVVSRDGKEARTLAPTVQEARNQGQMRLRFFEFLRTIPGNDEEIIAAGNMNDAESIDLYRLNVRTGRSTLMTQGRPSSYTASWVLDSKLVPRVVTAGVKDKLTQVVYYRDGENAPWSEIARFEPDKGPAFVPLAFESDDKTLQVASNHERNTMSVYRYDGSAKKMGELIAYHPRYDMGANARGEHVPGVLVSVKDDKIVGYRVDAAKPETDWTDAAYAKTQAALDATLKNRTNFFARTPDGKRLLVTSFSDVATARWFLFY